MKIALVHKEYSRNGETESYVADFADFLMARGDEVYFVTGRIRQTPPADLKICKLDLDRRNRMTRLKSFNTLAAECLDGLTLDCSIGFGLTSGQDFMIASKGPHRAYRSSTRAKKTWIRTLLESRKSVQKTIMELESAQYTHANLKGIISFSRLLKKKILNTFPVSENAIHVVYPGIKPAEHVTGDPYGPEGRCRNAWPGDAEKLVIGFLADDFALHGLDSLMEIVASSPATHLLVAGRDQTPPWRRRAQELHITQRTSFLGQLDAAGSGFFRSIDVMAFPTRYAPFSTACMLAAAHVIPVITTCYNGFHELIEDGKSGLVTDEAEPLAATAAGIERLKNRSFRRMLAKNAQDNIKHMTTETQFLKVYEILSSK